MLTPHYSYFRAPVQTDSGTHPASNTMGKGKGKGKGEGNSHSRTGHEGPEGE